MYYRKVKVKRRVLHYEPGASGNQTTCYMLIPDQNTVIACEHEHLNVNNPYQKES